ncbi:hypothetical protein [Enterococcus sp. BWR-S5]|uniref:hypothetical protein n=1 Tax=Enterococcus sp. BWR-S5 TaxID=2787714 RepID=UPI001920D4DC|nr:hypothetical protein [Enterococcus sp. BWR-S5]MBL1224017.1 hypothetical protein [Enterococcus sp. BWR-S5]
MYTDEVLNKLNQEAYYADPDYDKKITYVAKPDNELTGKEENQLTVVGKDFKVVASADIDNNGYQGFAVAPITKEYPQGDINNVAIISAGTNPDWKNPVDLVTAVTAKNTSGGGSLQTKQADDFVNFVINTQGYNVTQLSGYSQGAYMLKVGAKYKIPTTVFNGWFLYDSLDEDEKKFMMENPHLFKNYRRLDDSTVNYLDGNNREKITDFGTVFWFDGDSHGIKDWKFDKNGAVIFEETSSPTVKMSQIAYQASLGKWALFQLKQKFTASGGLSANEQIYLDDSEALLVVETVARMNETISTSLKKKYQDGITKAEELWQKTEQAAQNIGTTLSYAEEIEALESGGASKQTIVDAPASKYKEKIAKIDSQTVEYTSLITEIKASISKLVSSDQELASQI